MNLDNFVQFMELTGHKVIYSENNTWCEMATLFYGSIPFYEPISPSRNEIDGLFRDHRVIGIMYRTHQREKGKQGYVYVCSEKPYTIDSLNPKMRNKVRQGLKNCVVREIDFEQLLGEGLSINRDTLKRQKRDDRTFSQSEKWAEFCKAGAKVKGASAWGAFVNSQLAAYTVTFITGEYSNILYQFSRNDLLHTKANNALSFVMTKELLDHSGIKSVSYGQSSIRGNQLGLDEYKTRLGYQRLHVKYVVNLHPLVDIIITRGLGYRALDITKKLTPDNDLVKRVWGIVDIARESCFDGKI